MGGQHYALHNALHPLFFYMHKQLYNETVITINSIIINICIPENLIGVSYFWNVGLYSNCSGNLIYLKSEEPIRVLIALIIKKTDIPPKNIK